MPLHQDLFELAHSLPGFGFDTTANEETVEQGIQWTTYRINKLSSKERTVILHMKGVCNQTSASAACDISFDAPKLREDAFAYRPGYLSVPACHQKFFGYLLTFFQGVTGRPTYA